MPGCKGRDTAEDVVFGSDSMEMMSERGKSMCDFFLFHFIRLYQAHHALLRFFNADLETLLLSTVTKKGGHKAAGRNEDEEERPPLS